MKLREFQGGVGSSSLKECIELLNATIPKAPATCRSGSSHQTMDPTQVMSPNMEDSLAATTECTVPNLKGSLAETTAQAVSGSTSLATSQAKTEQQPLPTQVPSEETKGEAGLPNLEVKGEPDVVIVFWGAIFWPIFLLFNKKTVKINISAHFSEQKFTKNGILEVIIWSKLEVIIWSKLGAS